MNAESELRQARALEALRACSGGEWVEASAVARRLRDEGMDISAPALGRVLTVLSEEGRCEKSGRDGAGVYRVGMHAVVVYGADGVEAGRLLLVQTAGGLELDLGQLAELLPEQGWRLPVVGRDVRTVRAACDEALWKAAG